MESSNNNVDMMLDQLAEAVLSGDELTTNNLLLKINEEGDEIQKQMAESLEIQFQMMMAESQPPTLESSTKEPAIDIAVESEQAVDVEAPTAHSKSATQEEKSQEQITGNSLDGKAELAGDLNAVHNISSQQVSDGESNTRSLDVNLQSLQPEQEGISGAPVTESAPTLTNSLVREKTEADGYQDSPLAETLKSNMEAESTANSDINIQQPPGNVSNSQSVDGNLQSLSCEQKDFSDKGVNEVTSIVTSSAVTAQTDTGVCSDDLAVAIEQPNPELDLALEQLNILVRYKEEKSALEIGEKILREGNSLQKEKAKGILSVFGDINEKFSLHEELEVESVIPNSVNNDGAQQAIKSSENVSSDLNNDQKKEQTQSSTNLESPKLDDLAKNIDSSTDITQSGFENDQFANKINVIETVEKPEKTPDFSKDDLTDLVSPSEALSFSLDSASILGSSVSRHLAENLNQRQGFYVGSLGLMIGFSDGSELTEVPQIYKVPNSPTWFVGVSNIHGLTIPVFNLLPFFNIDLQSNVKKNSKPMLLVLQHGDQAFSILIDGLPKRITWGEKDLAEMNTAPQYLREYINNVCLIDGQLWFDLNTTALSDSLEQFMASQ